MSEPTLGEVLRRLDDVSRQMVDLAGQLREDRITAAQTYVRKDVYEARESAIERRVSDIENDADDKDKAQDAFRRQILAGLILAAVPALIGMVLAVNNFINTGGMP